MPDGLHAKQAVLCGCCVQDLKNQVLMAGAQADMTHAMLAQAIVRLAEGTDFVSSNTLRLEGSMSTMWCTIIMDKPRKLMPSSALAQYLLASF